MVGRFKVLWSKALRDHTLLNTYFHLLKLVLPALFALKFLKVTSILAEPLKTPILLDEVSLNRSHSEFVQFLIIS